MVYYNTGIEGREERKNPVAARLALFIAPVAPFANTFALVINLIARFIV
jgi:hypothetical protein